MRKFFGLGLLIVAAVACGGSADTVGAGASGGAGGTGTGGLPERVCEPGATQACVGPAKCDGGQVCNPDGMAWGVCDCGGGFAGSPATGGAPAVGGWLTAGGSEVGGTATGGFPESGGACSTSCALGNCCSTPNSYCVNGNVTCQCINGIWDACNLVGTGGGRNTGGAPSGGTATGGTNTGGRPTGGVSTGGTATGGKATGGFATGGGSTCIGSSVSSLPAMGTACGTPGESQCDPSDHHCVCERGIWYCDTSCATSYPTEPTPNTPCQPGAVCDYPSGASCACINSAWTCIGTSSCPTPANMPMTGSGCNDLTGVACDYPNTNPAFHMVCACAADPDGGSGSTWICFQSATCPATPPAYNLSVTCPGTAICTYSTWPDHCGCLQTGTPWVCGSGYFLFGVA